MTRASSCQVTYSTASRNSAAVRGEVNLGLVKGEIPEAVQRVLDTIEPDDHPALGAAYAEMSDAGVPAVTIDRMAYYVHKDSYRAALKAHIAELRRDLAAVSQPEERLDAQRQS